jgi:hypothetical protein
MDIRQQLQQEIDRHWREWQQRKETDTPTAILWWKRVIESAEEAWRSGTDADVVEWLDTLKSFI